MTEGAGTSSTSSTTARPGGRYDPRPEDRFTFGLWTVGWRGRDPFGAESRPPLDPLDAVQLLAEVGAYGVNFHDNDLVPIDASEADRERIVRDFRRATEGAGLKVPMATTNLFFDPVFRDGAFTSNDARVRAYALQKTMRAMDLGQELGAGIYVFWGGREGAEVDAGRDPAEAVKRFREALNYLCAYSIDHGYDYKFALEPKPNEPRGDLYFPTTGHYLALIETLDHPEMVGVNPEVAHETMCGLPFHHAVAQAWEAGKLFHIDLNDQKPGRYDQDHRFGSENLKGSFFLVKFLEDVGYSGMRHFDAHAYRTESPAGVKDFARGCMRSYLILKEKAARFKEDTEIQAALRELTIEDAALQELSSGYSGEKGRTLKEQAFDREEIARHRLPYERLDQLVIELLLGVR